MVLLMKISNHNHASSEDFFIPADLNGDDSLMVDTSCEVNEKDQNERE